MANWKRTIKGRKVKRTKNHFFCVFKESLGEEEVSGPLAYTSLALESRLFEELDKKKMVRMPDRAKI